MIARRPPLDYHTEIPFAQQQLTKGQALVLLLTVVILPLAIAIALLLYA
jgi:hypothetical protein